MLNADPNIPAGYVDSQGSDFATPENLKIYSVGINNQGAGGPNVQNGDTTQTIAQPNWPEGILNSPTGNATQVHW